MTTKLSTESLDTYGNTGGIGVQIQVPVITEYTVFAIPFDCTILKADWVTSTGTATFSVKIGSTGVTGLTSLSATTSPGTADATAANLVSAGNNIVFDVTAISSPENLSIMLTVEKTRD